MNQKSYSTEITHENSIIMSSLQMNSINVHFWPFLC
jgi:hypothetical protein